MQVVVDGGVAVAAVGGHRRRGTPGPVGAAGDRRRQLRRVGLITDLPAVVESDSVGVVDDLGLVAEFHRLAEPALNGGKACRIPADNSCAALLSQYETVVAHSQLSGSAIYGVNGG
ncbi:hypothetical protein DAVIS_01127 [Mycobacterium marinum]|uniref:Uncharacterized protein n=1 Tax=Mycobacterium marinum TaxID=1781 RepID=A0A3E2N099_MYCMR|nr:hypothetical protein DAVIS_01127 [Mycobacterium marinum]GJO36506.1 hypothetical protein NJB1604_00010 [Mycobacterium marinum]